MEDYSLQEIIANDLDRLFFNEDRKEFTTVHDIDGRDMTVIMDDELMVQRNIKDSIENIFLKRLVFSVRTKELGYIPQVESVMRFDGAPYLVETVNENMGLLELTLLSHMN